MDLEILWLLDLQTDNHPIRAHQIQKADSEQRTTYCGRTATRQSHPRGWWMGKPSSIPVPIHCGPWAT